MSIKNMRFRATVNRASMILLAVIMHIPIGSLALAQTSLENNADVIEQIENSTVLILSGEGAGRLQSISTGIIIKSNGIILTAYHAVKDVREVQVRLNTGEVYDQAVLIGVDERRDVAALKIPASGLAELPVGSVNTLRPGDTVFVVTNSEGLVWSSGKGILSASRMADEIPGAGQGYRVLQFTASVSNGASGGPLVNAQGELIGIITKGTRSGTGFAVPVESIAGLAEGTLNQALGSGSALQMPSQHHSPTSAAIVDSKPKEMLRSAKSLLVMSNTMFFTPETLEKEFAKVKNFDSLSMVIVKDRRVADLLITIDRPLFTYTFTYEVMDTKTSIVLVTGKVTAIDGNDASGKIAKKLVEEWMKVRAENQSSDD